MKTNVTCSLDAELVARLDAWRAKLGGMGRSAAIDLLLQTLPDQKMLEAAAALGRTDLALRGDGELLPVEPTDAELKDEFLSEPVVDEVTFLEPEVEEVTEVIEEPHRSHKKKHK